MWMYPEEQIWLINDIIDSAVSGVLIFTILFAPAAFYYRAVWRRRFYFADLERFMDGNAIIRGTIIDSQLGRMLYNDQRREMPIIPCLVVRTAKEAFMVAAGKAFRHGPPVEVGDRVTVRGDYATIAAYCEGSPYRESACVGVRGFRATNIARGSWLSPKPLVAIAAVFIGLSIAGLLLLLWMISPFTF